MQAVFTVQVDITTVGLASVLVSKNYRYNI
jgi:hypothetical protein